MVRLIIQVQGLQCRDPSATCSRHRTLAAQRPFMAGSLVVQGGRDRLAVAGQSSETVSMRHEDGHGHVLEDVAGGTAEHEFAQPGVTVSAHHQQVGAIVSEPGQ